MEQTQRKIQTYAAGGGKRLQVLGDEIFVKVAGEETGGSHAVIEEVTPPGGGPPLHMHHREDESFYVMEGEFEIRVGERVIRTTPGAFAFLPREIPHTFRNVGRVTGRMLVAIVPAGFEKFFEEVDGLSASGPPEVPEVLKLAKKYELDILAPPGV